MRRALILDLDYTLLHLEALPGAIEVPGRTRSAYLAATTAEALAEISNWHDIILATARSWRGTEPIVMGLAQRGISVFGVVLEDGALLGQPARQRPLELRRPWDYLRALLTAEANLPMFSWQEDFEACLVARTATPREAETLMSGLLPIALNLDPTLRLFRDGRKVYVTGGRADKWNALVALLGERAAGAVGIGDGANDACWLSQVASPCTFAGAAPDIVAVVEERSGLVSKEWGHEGITGLLWEVSQQANGAPRSGLNW